MSPTSLSGPERAPASGTVKHLVIFLHGYGSNGADLLGLAPMMDVPDTHFLSPNAPVAFEMFDGGYQWFALNDRDPERISREIALVAPTLDRFIDEQMARFHLEDAQVALVGFSQGSMMSLYTAPRRAKPLAGVVAFSGAMRGGETLAAEIKSRPPVCLIHGQMDDVVPFSAMAVAEDALRANGIPYEAYARPRLGHSIDVEGIAFATAFLKKSFGI